MGVKRFRLAAKKLFLTYPQCDIPLESVIIRLKLILDRWQIINYLIVKEKHLNTSGFHIHCFIECAKKVEISNSSKLNIIYNEQTFHGKYETVKNKVKVIDYILKSIDDVNDQNWCLISENLKPFIDETGWLDLPVAMIKLAEKGNIPLALQLLKKEKPMFYIRNHISIERNLRDLRMRELGFTANYNFKTFNIPENLQIAFNETFKDNKTLLLKGESGTGKTQLLEAYFQYKNMNPLIINDFNSLSKFQEGFNDSILLDDLSDFSNLNREALIKLFDSKSTATFRVLYRSVYIPKNIPRFICSNKSLKELIPKFHLDKAILRRLVQIDVGDLKLYKL